MKNKRLLIAFLVLEAIFFTFIAVDAIFNIVTFDTANLVKYASIFIFAIFSIMLLLLKQQDLKNKFLMCTSISCLVADFFLIFKTDYQVVGIAFFMLTSILYQAYLVKNYKLMPIQLGAGAIGVAIALIAKPNTTYNIVLTTMAIAYGCMCLYNIVSAIVIYTKEETFKNNLLFFIGMVLLFICDICIGLSAISPVHIFDKLEWIFYVPCQICMFMQMFKNSEGGLLC